MELGLYFNYIPIELISKVFIPLSSSDTIVLNNLFNIDYEQLVRLTWPLFYRKINNVIKHDTTLFYSWYLIYTDIKSAIDSVGYVTYYSYSLDLVLYSEEIHDLGPYKEFISSGVIDILDRSAILNISPQMYEKLNLFPKTKNLSEQLANLLYNTVTDHEFSDRPEKIFHGINAYFLNGTLDEKLVVDGPSITQLEREFNPLEILLILYLLFSEDLIVLKLTAEEIDIHLYYLDSIPDFTEYIESTSSRVNATFLNNYNLYNYIFVRIGEYLRKLF